MQLAYFIIEGCTIQVLLSHIKPRVVLALNILYFRIMQALRPCTLVQCKEQCWLFDVAEVNKKASTSVCIVYENAIK